nr:uncharacterized protein CI109_000691 [Kwoniella shandongensis]KAA5531119.1 hypothetical protein CI109_000691 [Kwoniella shandongensis]
MNDTTSNGSPSSGTMPKSESNVVKTPPPVEIAIPTPPIIADPAILEHKTEGIELDGTDPVDLNVKFTSAAMIKLLGVMSIVLLATFMAGYGVTTMTAINAMTTYQDYFDFDNSGVTTGLVFAMWPIAAAATFWIGPLLADKFGRRGGMFICSIVYILGTCLVAFAQNFGMLLSGRFFLGCSVGMMQTAAPPYIAEMAPPVNRGLLTGGFNCFWLLGAVTGTVIAILTNGIKSNWAWRIPFVVVIMASTVLFLPESPRWLYAHGYPERAKSVLCKYHGDGHLTPFVAKQLEQIAHSLRTQTTTPAVAVTSLWEYKKVANTRGKRYRLGLALLMGGLSQLPTLYKQVGVTNVRSQLIMTLVSNLVGLISSLIGIFQLDRLGRRPMLIITTSLLFLTLSLAMTCTAISTNGSRSIGGSDGVEAQNKSASRAAIAMLMLFNAVFSWGYTPLQATYPAEVLGMEQRSTGMGAMVLVYNLSSVLTQMTIPISLQHIGWWTYLPWVCWDAVETLIWYLVAVETKGRTLEGMDYIFDAPRPVAESLRRRRQDDESSPAKMEKGSAHGQTNSQRDGPAIIEEK